MVGREELMERQRVLGRFGAFVLRCDDLQEILTESCRLVADALLADFAKVIEIEHEDSAGIVRAGIGWSEGVVGKARCPLSENSSEAHAIRTAEPLVTNNIAEEDRFEFPAFMKEHGVVAAVNVPIFLPGGKAWGVLQVDAREARDFGEEDIAFLRTYAMVLGPVIDRLHLMSEVRHAAERFRLIVESARDYAIFLADQNDVVTDWLPGAAGIFGWSAYEIVGKPAAIVFTPEDRESGLPEREIAKAKEEGKAPNVRWHVRKDGSRVFIDGQTIALRYPDGRIRGFMKIGQDVTDRRRDEERQAVLQAELQHRVRNVLAMVRSVVNRGLDHGSAEAFRAELDGRIAAMARTQALLTRDTDMGIDLRRLVEDELVAHATDEGRIEIAGPPVVLAAKAAEILTLAVHELTTNAIKYGALRQPGGRIVISWRIEPEGEIERLRLIWREDGVEIAPDAARRTGFGTELVTRRVPYELNGEGRIDLERDGLRCEIAFALIPGESTLQTNAPEAVGLAGTEGEGP